MIRILFAAIAIMMAATVVQDKNFGFRRKLDPIAAPGWYNIEIAPDIQEKIKEDLADMRLYNIQEQDTSEVPFVIRMSEDKLTEKEFAMEVLNKSKKDGKLHLTLSLPEGAEKINQVTLQFEEPDFDGA